MPKEAKRQRSIIAKLNHRNLVSLDNPFSSSEVRQNKYNAKECEQYAKWDPCYHRLYARSHGAPNVIASCGFAPAGDGPASVVSVADASVDVVSAVLLRIGTRSHVGGRGLRDR